MENQKREHRRERKKRSSDDQIRERARRKKMQQEKCRKVANKVFIQFFCGARGLKTMLAKAAGAEPFGQLSDQKLHAIVVRSTCRKKRLSAGVLLEVGLAGGKLQATDGARHMPKPKCKKSQVVRSTFQSTFCSKRWGAPACL